MCLQPSKVMFVSRVELGPWPWLVNAATDTEYDVNGVKPTYMYTRRYMKKKSDYTVRVDVHVHLLYFLWAYIKGAASS